MTLINNLFSKAPDDMNALGRKTDEVLPEEAKRAVREGAPLVMSFEENGEEKSEAPFELAGQLTLFTEEAPEEPETFPEDLEEDLPASEAAPAAHNDDAFLAELRALLDAPLGESQKATAEIPETEIPDAEQPETEIPETPVSGEPAAETPAAEETAEPEPVPEAPAPEGSEAPAAEEAPEEAPAEEPAGEPAGETPEEAKEEPEDAAEAEAAPEAAGTEEAPEAQEAEETADEVKTWPPVDPEASKMDKILEKDTLTRVSYASVAEAALSKQADPNKKTRAPIDDETLLAELYALMGDAPKKPAQATEQKLRGAQAAAEKAPAGGRAAAEEAARRHAIVDVERPDTQTELEAEEEIGGAPGWLKGAFLLLLSLLLGGMTFYAIATDLFGKLF